MSTAQCIQESILVALNEKVNFQQTTNEVCEMAPLVLFFGTEANVRICSELITVLFFYPIVMLRLKLKPESYY
jgi:hypothetical protein